MQGWNLLKITINSISSGSFTLCIPMKAPKWKVPWSSHNSIPILAWCWSINMVSSTLSFRKLSRGFFHCPQSREGELGHDFNSWKNYRRERPCSMAKLGWIHSLSCIHLLRWYQKLHTIANNFSKAFECPCFRISCATSMKPTFLSTRFMDTSSFLLGYRRAW